MIPCAVEGRREAVQSAEEHRHPPKGRIGSDAPPSGHPGVSNSILHRDEDLGNRKTRWGIGKLRGPRIETGAAPLTGTPGLAMAAGAVIPVKPHSTPQRIIGQGKGVDHSAGRSSEGRVRAPDREPGFDGARLSRGPNRQDSSTDDEESEAGEGDEAEAQAGEEVLHERTGGWRSSLYEDTPRFTSTLEVRANEESPRGFGGLARLGSTAVGGCSGSASRTVAARGACSPGPLRHGGSNTGPTSGPAPARRGLPDQPPGWC
jgi:hypothetical protein